MKNFKLLRKCQELQLQLCGEVYVNIDSSPNGYITVTLFSKVEEFKAYGYLHLSSNDKDFETRIDYLMEHGHKPEVAV